MKVSEYLPMNTSPRIHNSPTLSGRSIPMNPERQIDFPIVVILIIKIWTRAVAFCSFNENSGAKQYIEYVVLSL